jgi:hypothetical protein
MGNRSCGDDHEGNGHIPRTNSDFGRERVFGQRSGGADEWKKLCGSESIGAPSKRFTEFQRESDDVDARGVWCKCGSALRSASKSSGKRRILKGVLAGWDRGNEFRSRRAFQVHRTEFPLAQRIFALPGN